MPESSAEFTALVTRVRLGDPSALAELLHHYEAELRLAARVMLGPSLRPHLDSVDLVQSVHHTLLAGLQAHKYDFASPQKLLALAVTLLRRKVARRWRQVKQERRLTSGTAETNPLALAVTAGRNPEPDPASTAVLRDTLQHLDRNLDETERRLIELRLQGCGTAEAAGRLGLDPDVLRVRLSRLRRRLREGKLLEGWL